MEPDKNKFMLDRLNALPEELQKFILSETLERKTQLVAKKYRLTEKQEAKLSNEILLVLLVLDSVDSLHLNIENTLTLTPEISENLALDISDYILKSVDKYLAHTQEELFKSKTIEDEGSVAYSSVVNAPIKEEKPIPEINLDEVEPESSIPTEEPLINFVPKGTMRQNVFSNSLPEVPEEPLTKEHILNTIENPPRTVIKKYVLEHEPITDPEHLIDDTIDHRAKLESHYDN